MLIREFEDRDYERMAAIGAAIDPERSRNAAWFRQRDANLGTKIHQVRLIAEADGAVVGWGDIYNTWWAYHPRKFQLRLNVDPPHQRQGIGSAIFARLLQHTESNWQPLRVNTETRETRPEALEFLEHRGFREVARRWESVLLVSRAPLDSSVAMHQRMTEQRFRIASFADERQVRGEPALQRDLFELEQLVYHDEPGYDPEGALIFDQFIANKLDPEVFIDDASFLALDGERLVGISRIERDPAGTHRLHVGFTGIHPEYRGRGIATALKLRTLEYAQAHNVHEMRTTNDASNAAMLHINEALGFERLPAWVVFEKNFPRD